MVFKLLKVEVGFVAYRHSIADYICAFGGVVARFHEVVRDVYGFVVGALDDLAVQGERGECDFKANNVAFTERGVGRHEVLWSRHMHFLPRDVAEAVAVGVEADGSIEAGFTAGPADTHVASVIIGVVLVAGGVVGGFYAAEDLTFPVPAAFADPNIGAGHAEAFFCGDAAAGEIEEDVGGGIFEVKAGAVGFGFGLAVIL